MIMGPFLSMEAVILVAELPKAMRMLLALGSVSSFTMAAPAPTVSHPLTFSHHHFPPSSQLLFQSCPLFLMPWTAAHQASLSLTISQNLPKLMFTASVMSFSPSHPLTLSSPSDLNLSQHQGLFQWVIMFTSDEQNTGASASASVLPVNIQGWSPLRLAGLISLQSKGLSVVFSSSSLKASSMVLCLLYGPALETICDHQEDHSLDCTDLCQQSNVSAFQQTV